MSTLAVVSDSKALSEAQGFLRNRLIEAADREAPIAVGFQSGSIQKSAYYFKAQDFWGFWLAAYTSTSGKQRYFNAFGVGAPERGKNHSITVEVNMPIQGVNRMLGGVFLAGSDAQVSLGHRGRIGGGRQGIGKDLFEKQSADDWVEVDDGDRVGRVVLIGAIGGADFVDRLGNFVHAVVRMKCGV